MASGLATPSAPDRDVREVETALAAFLRAFDTLDLPAFIACFDSKVTFFAPTGRATRIDGRDAIADFFSGVFAQTKRESGRTQPPYMHLDPRDLRVQQTGDCAIVTFHLAESDGIHRRTLVFARNHGGWRIVHLHASNLGPPAAT